MEINLAEMKVARRLCGDLIDGYAGYYKHTVNQGKSYVVVIVPQDETGYTELMDSLIPGSKHEERP